MRLQRFHDGQLCIVLKPGRLVLQNLLQHTQGQRTDGVLGVELKKEIRSPDKMGESEKLSREDLRLYLPASPGGGAGRF